MSRAPRSVCRCRWLCPIGRAARLRGDAETVSVALARACPKSPLLTLKNKCGLRVGRANVEKAAELNQQARPKVRPFGACQYLVTLPRPSAWAIRDRPFGAEMQLLGCAAGTFVVSVALILDCAFF